jgi:4'-phosphopantetheinyl transferase
VQSAEERIYLSHASLVLAGWRHLYDLLSDQERRRADAFFFECDARRFVVSHAVLRTLLSRSTGIPARELKFRTERGRKPVLETQSGQPIHFSLSRSEELVLIGFAPRPLGVDLEWTCKTLDIQL